jgi:hypothetical protein
LKRHTLKRNIEARLARLEHLQQREDLAPIDALTIATFDSIVNDTISDQMLTRCLPAIQRILGQNFCAKETKEE